MDIVIIHGWSDNYSSMKNKFGNWLESQGHSMHYINYNSLEDCATLEDIAEGLYEELKRNGTVKNLLEGSGRTLNFITHSTGALVVRQMLRQYAWLPDGGIAARVARIIFLAPANFGSPLAHKAASVLGRIAKGNKDLEDFGEVGKKILQALELASPKQWELADFDLFNANGTLYGADKIRGYVLTGNTGYTDIIRSFVNEDGTDGTIVVAGANLNSRKYILDFVHGKEGVGWHGSLPELPFAVYSGLNHSTILEWQNTGYDILHCLTGDDYIETGKIFGDRTYNNMQTADNYQQFVFRLTDDKNMPVTDYHLQFNVWERGRVIDNKVTVATEDMNDHEAQLSARLDTMLQKNGHSHSQSPEYRRFLVSPKRIKELLGSDYVITISIAAESGDDEIYYRTEVFENNLVFDPQAPGSISMFFNNTTTLVEVTIDRYSTLVSRK